MDATPASRRDDSQVSCRLHTSGLTQRESIMRHIIDPATHLRHGKGSFQIRRIRPGMGIDPGDTGFGALGLVDRAHLSSGLVVPMHEHRDDEIVSYLRSGTLTHEDSTGRSEDIGRDRLMVMNAGSGFSHEERMREGDDIHMLQIFIRPHAAGLEPRVQFADLIEAERDGRWRTLVGPEGSDAPATVRQSVHLMDASLDRGERLVLPQRPGFDQWLYVFDGAVAVDGETLLAAGNAMATSGDPIAVVEALEPAEVVLFLLQHGASITRAGSLSGGVD